jgi:hypothetical protein
LPIRKVGDGEHARTAFPRGKTAEEGMPVAPPGDVDLWVRADVGTGEHFADVLDDDWERLFARGCVQRPA